MKKNLLWLCTGLLAVIFAACSKDDNIPEEKKNYSPYINKVYEFVPAVGQHINTMPEYKPDDTPETMLKKVDKAIANNAGGMISLGGFGGYVIFGFDHLVENVSGQCDFRVLGNAFFAEGNPNKDTSKQGGSCEPGIIMVAYDANKNGKPDDKWYQIAGSEYNKANTVKNYELTYYRPEQENGEQIENYIRWEDNQGKSGYIAKNKYHKQSYFPQWINAAKLTFKGRLLPQNGVNEGTEEKPYWVQYAFNYGYADNMPNGNDKSAVDIGWAVDENGEKVNLPGIHFVKVYNAEHQVCGWLGDTSTDISGAEDLHLVGKVIKSDFTEN